MAGEYGKLLLNTGNIVGAALGSGARFGRWYQDAKEEEGRLPRRRHRLRRRRPRRSAAGADEGRRDRRPSRAGSSSVQSLVRGSGSIETDYLNWEIALLGRLHGIPTPVNAALVRVAHRMVCEGIEPRTFPEAEIERLATEG